MVSSLSSLLFLSTAFKLLAKCVANRAIPFNGATCSPQFSTPEAALTIPDSAISWLTSRVFTCEDPIFWLDTEAVIPGQELAFTVGVPLVDRFEGVRMTVVFMGPSLPALLPDGHELPEDITDLLESDSSLGAIVFESPEDQSTCDHLKSEAMREHTEVMEGRCFFFEEHTGTANWIILDDAIEAPEAGVYKIAIFVNGGTPAKAWYACCGWYEDFQTEFDMPDSECSFCGYTTEENPLYYSHFFEEGSMEEYGGFPPMISCATPEAIGLKPSADYCPPMTTDDIQSEGCELGCSRAECYSHNILGECNYDLGWLISPSFDEAEVSKVVIFKGDKITFNSYDVDEQLAHDLYGFPDAESFEQCDFQEATKLANVEDVLVGYPIMFGETGVYHFSCRIGCYGSDDHCHCTMGQKLTVEVKDVSDSMRCHDHGHLDGVDPLVLEESTLLCSDGQVNACTVNHPVFGAMTNKECAELCATPPTIMYMPRVEEGTCAELGFLGPYEDKTIQPPGSPIAFPVRIFSFASTCHCHSYEQIPCPLDDNQERGYTLYHQYMHAIEEFCAGVINGTETVCPLNCFQPFEALHLHYLDCPAQPPHPTYLQVNSTNLCHMAAVAPPGTECPKVALGNTSNASQEEATTTSDSITSLDEDDGNPRGTSSVIMKTEPFINIASIVSLIVFILFELDV